MNYEEGNVVVPEHDTITIFFWGSFVIYDISYYTV